MRANSNSPHRVPAIAGCHHWILHNSRCAPWGIFSVDIVAKSCLYAYIFVLLTAFISICFNLLTRKRRVAWTWCTASVASNVNRFYRYTSLTYKWLVNVQGDLYLWSNAAGPKKNDFFFLEDFHDFHGMFVHPFGLARSVQSIAPFLPL